MRLRRLAFPSLQAICAPHGLSGWRCGCWGRGGLGNERISRGCARNLGRRIWVADEQPVDCLRQGLCLVANLVQPPADTAPPTQKRLDNCTSASGLYMDG
eukprot:1159813-Pelagomonas_calceolata.AAC.9